MILFIYSLELFIHNNTELALKQIFETRDLNESNHQCQIKEVMAYTTNTINIVYLVRWRSYLAINNCRQELFRGM
jgi:hypothetical protein